MKKNFSLRMELELREQLQEIADKEGRTLTNLIIKILSDFIKEYKNKRS